MSFNKNNFEQINKSTFVRHNFISEDLCDTLVEIAKKQNIEHKLGEDVENPILFFNTDSLPNEIINLFYSLEEKEERCFFAGFTFSHVLKGSHWFPHRDTDGYTYKNGEKVYGGVLYLTDAEGGTLFYPEMHSYYHPKKGDLVLHHTSALHYTSEVESNDRYTITLYVWSPIIKNENDLREVLHDFGNEKTRKEFVAYFKEISKELNLEHVLDEYRLGF